MRKPTRVIRGSGYTPVKPTLVWNSTGTFRITNYNSNLIYQTTAGSVSGNIVTLPSASQSANVTARVALGIPASPAGYCERLARASYFVETEPMHCDLCGGPCGGCCGAGTEYPEGFLACCACGYYADVSYTSAGYTDQGSEWSKVA